jgi:hypothetical protein
MPGHPVTTTLRIRDCGHDEYWLRDEIEANPSILGLGPLLVVMKEKVQSQGGRLDLLLKHPDADTMYEVELQLGKVDESHIIRTIEYWDYQKRRWPSLSHTAVLVAEEINTRFFNVVQLLSKAVPIIGIQANMVQVGDSKALHFATIIDSFLEEEFEQDSQVDERYWREKYPATVECARWYRDLLARSCKDVSIRFGKTMVTLYVRGVVRIAVWPRTSDRALISVEKLDDADLVAAESALLRLRTSFSQKEGKLLFLNTPQQLKDAAAAHEWLAERISKES